MIGVEGFSNAKRSLIKYCRVYIILSTLMKYFSLHTFAKGSCACGNDQKGTDNHNQNGFHGESTKKPRTNNLNGKI